MRQNIQEWTKQNLWKTAFKKCEVISSNFLKAVFHKSYVTHFMTLISFDTPSFDTLWSSDVFRGIKRNQWHEIG